MNQIILKNAVYELTLSPSQGYVCNSLKRITGKNIVDDYDDGRLFGNRSFYGNKIVGTWAGQPWPLNGIQAGDHTSIQNPTIASQTLISLSKHMCSVIPVDWSTGRSMTEFRIDQSYELDGQIIIYKSRLRQLSGEIIGEWDQEESAMFLQRKYCNLITSGGRQELPRQDVPGFKSVYGVLDGWYGLVDNKGYGLWSTTNSQRWTGYVVSNIGKPGACSYVAPLGRHDLYPGLDKAIECRMYIGTRPYASKILGIPA